MAVVREWLWWLEDGDLLVGARRWCVMGLLREGGFQKVVEVLLA
jgi:hypothetical protein